MEWLLMPLKRYAEFTGRSRRKEFWPWILFVTIMFFVLMYLDTVLGLGGTTEGSVQGGSLSLSMSGGVLTLMFGLAVLLPSAAVSVRRMHDVGTSGIMVLIGIVPLIGWGIVLYFYAHRGEPGPNKYGPDPKGSDNAEVFT